MLQIVCDVDEYLPPVCAELDVHLTKGDRHLNMRPLLRLICQRFFGEFAGMSHGSRWMETTHIEGRTD